MQLTPLLLTTITHIVDSATPVLKHDNPMSVISQLVMHCANEAADRIPDDQDLDSKEQGIYISTVINFLHDIGQSTSTFSVSRSPLSNFL